MAISSTVTVDAEYADRRTQIVEYPATTLDADLARLEVLAEKLQEALDLLRAREALHERAYAQPSLERAVTDIRNAISGIRGAVATAKAQLPA